MSRRNTYLLGGLAVAAGIAMVVVAIVALTSGGDESPPSNDRNAPERPITGSPAPTPEGGSGGGEETGGASGNDSKGTNARGAGIHRDLVRRRPVRAPDFSAPLIHDGSIPGRLADSFQGARNGNELDFAELRGTPVVLYLWSAQCAPCRSDTRLIEATWKRWSPRGVLFLAANVKDSTDTAKAVIRQYHLTYPSVSDGGGKIAELYGATALPQTFFISAGGDIVGEVSGAPSVRQLEVGTAAAKSGEAFGSEQGSSRLPIP